MIIPLLALVLVLIIVVYFVVRQAKQKDQGNRPSRS